MDLASVVGPAARVIEVGAPDAGVARALARMGRHRYLGLVPATELARVRATAGELAPRFHALSAPSEAVRNNADVLVLRRAHAPLLWAVRDLQHLGHLLVERGGAEVLAARTSGRLGGVVRLVGRTELAGTTFDVLETTRRRRPRRPRRYLSPVWGVTGLAGRLEQDGVRYAVLRWFEALPAVAAGEDLDILVSDRDLDRLSLILDEEPGTIPVDVYSESGLPGSDFRDAAYYPPPLAAALLDRAGTHPSGVRVPAPLDHLHSLAYHACYHKGHASGLPSAEPVPDPGPSDHDYATTLAKLARDHGLEVELTLEGLDTYLGRVGWRPPADTLRRLAVGNQWLELRLARGAPAPAPTELPQPAVFLVRERAVELLGIDRVRRALEHYGFEVVLERRLTPEAAARTASHARGGNWGPGPFAVSGGAPVVAVVAVHYAPTPVHPALRDRYPRLANAEVYHAKNRVRQLVRRSTSRRTDFNPLHSSDDEAEAWEYVRLALPEDESWLREAVRQRRREYRTPVPVLRTLSRGRRAKVEVVDDGAGAVVRKTYAGAFRGHLEREVAAMRTLGPLCAEVPEVIDTGPTWFELPYYDDLLRIGRPGSGRRLVPLRTLRQMVSVLRRLHDLGYELPDAKPDNFLLDAQQGLKVIDLEFLHHGRTVGELRSSMSFVAPPDDFPGELPVGDLGYERRWLPHTGMPLAALVGGSPLVQHAHRIAFRVRRATVLPGAPTRQVARAVLDRARRTKGRAVWAYRVWARRRAVGASEGVW